MGKTGSFTSRAFTSWAGCALCALAMAVALPASAATIQIVPGTSMEMEAPGGQCLIEPSANQFDAAYFATMNQMYVGTNNLLALFIDCNVLTSMRQGIAQPITHWTIVLLPLSGGQVVSAAGYTRAQVIEEMTKAATGTDLQAYLDGQKGSIEQRIGETMQGGYQMGQIKSLGILAKDDAGIYSGLLMSQTMAGVPQTIACVIGMTLINGYVVTMNSYRPYENAETYTAMIADMKGDMAALVSMNGGASASPATPGFNTPSFTPGTEASTASGTGNDKTILVIVLGLGVVLAGGLVGFFLTRRKPGQDS
jgi:hypothetical protein